MWQKFKSKVKKGRSGSLRGVSNQELAMSDHKFRQCHSSSVLPRSGAGSGLDGRPTRDSGPPDYETAQSLTSHPPSEGSESHKTALLDHLAEKYPDHADIIRSTGRSNYDSASARHRGLASVMHGSQSSVAHQSERMASSCCDMEAGSPVGSVGLGSCRELRSTLPVVRSPNKSMERPLGQVFLVLHGETKRAILPNEVTSIDTVRALFVRSFPKSLSMRWFDSPYRKIYILDSTTNVFYELEDLSDIKDRVVLKIFEHSECMTLTNPRALQQTRPASEALGRITPQDFTTSSVCSSPHEVMDKTRSLPPSVSSLQMYSLQQQQQSVALPLQCTTHHWSNMSQQCLSPSRALPSNPRHSVACLPEPTSCNSSLNQLSQSLSCHDYTDRDFPISAYSSGTVTPSGGDVETRNRMQKMESQLANLTAWVKTAMYKQGKTADTDVSHGSSQRNALTSAPNSAMSSASDISTCTTHPILSMSMLNTMCILRRQAHEMRLELNQLRHMQITYAECLRASVQNAFEKIKLAICNVPDLRNLPVSRTRRLAAQAQLQNYNLTAEQVKEGLRDLDRLVEEIRKDVVGRRCRVNMTEVESLALALSHISRCLADLKSEFPELHTKLKSVMETEMEVVVQEEKFLREEPTRIDESLKQSKKLMGTLLTLKKLASVQEKRPVSVPVVATKHELTEDDHKALLLNIQATIPNHEARMQSIEEAALARERKRKITGNIDSMRFEKIIELAQRQLRETDNVARNVARQELALNLIYQHRDISEEVVLKDGNTVEQTFDDLNGLGSACCSPHSSSKSPPDNGDDKNEVLMKSACDENLLETESEPEQNKQLSLSEIKHSESEILLPSHVSDQPVKTDSPDLGLNTTNLRDSPSKVISPTTVSVKEIVRSASVVISSTGATTTVVTTTTKTTLSTFTSPIDSRSLAVSLDSSTIPSVCLSSSVPSLATVGSSLVTKEPPSNKIVTDAKDSLCENHSRQKKMPPPPPPRKTTSPQGPGSSIDGSEGLYENVENCKLGIVDQSVAVSKAERPRSVFGVASTKPESVSLTKPRPISEYSSEASKQLPTKGSSSGDRVNGKSQESTNISQTVVDKLSVVCCQRDSDSDSSTSADSQTGTIKRTPFSKEEPAIDKKQVKSSTDDAVANRTNINGSSVSRDGARVPPPVPLRKTSTLSSLNRTTSSPVAQHQYSNLQELRRERMLLEKQGSGLRRVARVQDSSSIPNGEIGTTQATANHAKLNTSHATKTDRRKCEETEIY